MPRRVGEGEEADLHRRPPGRGVAVLRGGGGAAARENAALVLPRRAGRGGGGSSFTRRGTLFYVFLVDQASDGFCGTVRVAWGTFLRSKFWFGGRFFALSGNCANLK